MEKCWFCFVCCGFNHFWKRFQHFLRELSRSRQTGEAEAWRSNRDSFQTHTIDVLSSTWSTTSSALSPWLLSPTTDVEQHKHPIWAETSEEVSAMKSCEDEDDDDEHVDWNLMLCVPRPGLGPDLAEVRGLMKPV